MLLACGCTSGPQGPERLATVPVKGTVLVDGKPAPQLSIRFHSKEKPQGEVAIYAANPTAMTDNDGAFSVSTYESGDGMAAGTYDITFEWLTYSPRSASFVGPDKLGGKYSDPGKSEFKVTVTGDEDGPIELEPFQLFTK